MDVTLSTYIIIFTNEKNIFNIYYNEFKLWFVVLMTTALDGKLDANDQNTI